MLSRIIEAIVERGDEQVAAALSRAMAKQRCDLLELDVTPLPSPLRFIASASGSDDARQLLRHKQAHVRLSCLENAILAADIPVARWHPCGNLPHSSPGTPFSPRPPACRV